MVNKQTIKAACEMAEKIVERLNLGEGAMLQKSDGSRLSILSMSDMQIQDELRELEDEWNRQQRSGLLRKSSGIGLGNVAATIVESINKGKDGLPDYSTFEKHRLRQLRKALR